MDFSSQKSKKSLARRSLTSEFEFNKSATTFESSKKRATSTFHLNNTITGAVVDRSASDRSSRDCSRSMFATMRKTTIRISKKLHSSLKKIESVKKLEKLEKSNNIKRSPKILKSNEEEISNDVVIWEEQFCQFKHLGTF